MNSIDFSFKNKQIQTMYSQQKKLKNGSTKTSSFSFNVSKAKQIASKTSCLASSQSGKLLINNQIKSHNKELFPNKKNESKDSINEVHGLLNRDATVNDGAMLEVTEFDAFNNRIGYNEVVQNNELIHSH